MGRMRPGVWSWKKRLRTIHSPHRNDVVITTIVPESLLTCPHCGFSKLEIMPTDACQFYYACSNCEAVLRARILVTAASSARSAR